MSDELQVEPGDSAAGVALARRRLADVADAALENGDEVDAYAGGRVNTAGDHGWAAPAGDLA